ncbi:MAG: hypothetical protein HUJ65_04955 [Oscillospiraceae bacterium]|nr:hypothetical protein [Oscillospiraceae bacterium]
MSKEFEKDCACKAAELSLEDVENIAGGVEIVSPSIKKVAKKGPTPDMVSSEKVNEVLDFIGQYN